MFNLVIKDILIQKKSFAIGFVYSFFLFIIFNNPVFNQAVYIMGTVAIAYIMVVTSNAYDDKYKSDIIFNSLPIKRKTVVAAKYIAAVAFVGIGLLILGLVGGVMVTAGISIPIRYIGISDIVFSLTAVTLLISLYYPAYFRFGYALSRIVSLVLFMIAFFVPGVLARYLRENFSYDNANQIAARLLDLPGWAAMMTALAGVLVLALVSAVISVRIYEARDF